MFEDLMNYTLSTIPSDADAAIIFGTVHHRKRSIIVNASSPKRANPLDNMSDDTLIELLTIVRFERAVTNQQDWIVVIPSLFSDTQPEGIIIRCLRDRGIREDCWSQECRITRAKVAAAEMARRAILGPAEENREKYCAIARVTDPDVKVKEAA